MLPRGVLSKHGYTVPHGYFQGMCRGAGELPFELSCDLVKTFIGWATDHLTRVETFQTNLRAPATEPKAWLRVGYENPKGPLYPKVYEWEEVPLANTFERYSTGDGGSLHYTYTDKRGTVHGNSRFSRLDGVQRWDVNEGTSDADILLATCTNYNAIYAKWLEHEVVTLRRYIAWQTDRVTTWTLQSLLPVAHRDREGFKPTVAPY